MGKSKGIKLIWNKLYYRLAHQFYQKTKG